MKKNIELGTSTMNTVELLKVLKMAEQYEDLLNTLQNLYTFHVGSNDYNAVRPEIQIKYGQKLLSILGPIFAGIMAQDEDIMRNIVKLDNRYVAIDGSTRSYQYTDTYYDMMEEPKFQVAWKKMQVQLESEEGHELEDI